MIRQGLVVLGFLAAAVGCTTGAQTFEQDLARLITQGTITRDEGLAFADSPTNLMWRLQNDMSPVSRIVPISSSPRPSSIPSRADRWSDG